MYTDVQKKKKGKDVLKTERGTLAYQIRVNIPELV